MVGSGANQGQKCIRHPRNKGVPCCEPLGPTFVDPKAPLPGLTVGSRVDPRVKTYGPWVLFRTPKIIINQLGSHMAYDSTSTRFLPLFSTGVVGVCRDTVTGSNPSDSRMYLFVFFTTSRDSPYLSITLEIKGESKLCYVSRMMGFYSAGGTSTSLGAMHPLTLDPYPVVPVRVPIIWVF